MGATAKGDNPAGTIGYESIFACGLTLFVLTLLMNTSRSGSSASTERSTTEGPPPPAEAASPGRAVGRGFDRDAATRRIEAAFKYR